METPSYSSPPPVSDEKGPQKVFYRAIREGRFEPVYYLHGDEDFLMDGAVRDLIRRATDPATRDFNLEVRRGAEVDAPLLGSLLGTPPMMADHRVVVIRDVNALKKEPRAVLDRYLASPARDLILVLVGTAGTKPDKALESGSTSVAFGALSGDRVARWILHHGREALGVEISPEAASLLHATVGDDLRELAGELQKLAAFASHSAGHGVAVVVDETAVTEAVGVRRGETVSDLLDCLANRDARGALALVGHVLSQPKTSGVTLVMVIAAQTLAIGWALASMAEGLPRSQVSSGLFGLLKAKSVMTARPWGEAVSTWSRAATSGCWTSADIDNALEALVTADIALKQTGVSSEEQIMVALILTMCASAAPGRAA